MELYDRYSSVVYAVALRVLGDTGAAEDVLQEVFLQLWRKPSAFDAARGSLGKLAGRDARIAPLIPQKTAAGNGYRRCSVVGVAGSGGTSGVDASGRESARGNGQHGGSSAARWRWHIGKA